MNTEYGYDQYHPNVLVMSVDTNDRAIFFCFND